MTKEGVADVSQRDLGLLLEAVALTTNPKTQADLVEYGLLQAFQVCVHKLGGAGAGPDYVPILRKIIKIIDNIMTNSPRLVKDGVVKARTARGTLAQALADLRRSPDSGLRGLAAGFCAKLDQDAIASAGGYGVTPGRVSPAFGAAGGGANAPPPPYAARGAGGGYYGASPAGSAAAGSGGAAVGGPPPGSTPSRPPLAPAPPASTPNGNFRPGDWHCPKGCGVVFASKSACFRCGERKPADADYATPQMRRSGSWGMGPDGFAAGSVASGGSVGPGSGSKWSEHPTPGSGYPDRSAGKPCHNCGEIGHLARDCPARRCRGCGGFGHVVRDCPSAQPYARPAAQTAHSGVGAPAPSSLSSIAPGGKRDRWDDAPGGKRARVEDSRGGWGGVVRDRDPPPAPRSAPPGMGGPPGGISAPPGMGVGGISAPPGMGVGGISAPPGNGRRRPRAEVGGGAEAAAASAARAVGCVAVEHAAVGDVHGRRVQDDGVGDGDVPRRVAPAVHPGSKLRQARREARQLHRGKGEGAVEG